MIISLVAAASDNNVIGAKGKIPWHLPADLKFFRKLTEGHPVIMGRKTYESIGHPLPRRRNIVISRQEGFKAEGCEVVKSLEEALECCSSLQPSPRLRPAGKSDVSEVFIIGGGEIYKQALSLADRIYLTRVHVQIEGDAFFPKILEGWIEKSRERHEPDSENSYAYTFLTYEKKK